LKSKEIVCFYLAK